LAWRITTQKTLRHFFEGLSGLPGDVRAFVDLVYLDLFPETTRELAAWSTEFALSGEGTEATRRLRLTAAWRAQGGQSPDYLQSVIHAAGFTGVYVHEWWEVGGPPFVSRDPRLHTTPPLFGFYQCEATTPWECFDSQPGDLLAPHCDDTLLNDPGYLVNLDLTRRPPPPVPDDPAFWPYFLYFSGETFPETASVDFTRIEEFKELILRISPSQQWLVTLIEPGMPDPLVIHELQGPVFPAGLLLSQDDSVIELTSSALTLDAGDGELRTEGVGVRMAVEAFPTERTVCLVDSDGDSVQMGFHGSSSSRPSISGVTTQEQIDSLVSALRALGLVA
jgi:hypothetical protein